MSKADYFQKMGCEDALSGKLLTNTLQYFIRQFGFEHENTQSYISGYESSLKESLPLLKKASEEKEIREKLMAQLNYVLGADLDEEERDTHIPVEHIYGTQMKKLNMLALAQVLDLELNLRVKIAIHLMILMRFTSFIMASSMSRSLWLATRFNSYLMQTSSSLTGAFFKDCA